MAKFKDSKELIQKLEWLNLKPENLKVLIELLRDWERSFPHEKLDTPKKVVEAVQGRLMTLNSAAKVRTRPMWGGQKDKATAHKIADALRELRHHYNSGFLGIGQGEFR